MEKVKAPLTVRQLNLYAKSILENDVNLSFCSVSGEITNFKRHYASGHLYFTLSDGFAAIKCVMFRSNALRCTLDLKDGMKIIVTGRVSLYEKDGGYQLYAETINEDGLGDKLLALKKLKEKLAAEGLFDADSKRKIKIMPKRIAVITSGTGAALQDIINITSRRFPLCEVVLCSAAVQGELAAKQLINALDRVYNIADSIDTVIIGRGGGSSEDLDAFNDEELARKIYSSPIPVISAVGHETDITICDMVADLRAPTPSAAAELAVPDKNDYILRISELCNKCCVNLTAKADLSKAQLNGILSRPILKSPTHLFDEKAVSVDKYIDIIFSHIKSHFNMESIRLNGAITRIEALSPMKTFARGFVFGEILGNPLTKIGQVQIGDSISLRLTDGKLNCKVTDKEY